MPDCAPLARATKASAAPEAAAENQLYETLYFADSWFDVVRALHDQLGLTKAEVARAAGVTTMTVGRWLERQGQDIRAPRGLDDLRFMVLAMLRDGAMTPRLLRFWLAARDLELGTDALTAIGHGRFEEVLEAGRAFTSMRRPTRMESAIR